MTTLLGDDVDDDDVNKTKAMEISQSLPNSFNAPWLCPISLIKNIQGIQQL